MTLLIAMETTAQTGGSAASDVGSVPDQGATQKLSAAIDLLWVRFLPEILARIEVLESAAAACSGNQLSTTQWEAGHAAAHKLAGSLGTFNLANGSDLAREFEVLFANQAAPDSSLAGRLASIAAELRAIVEERRSAAEPG